MPASCPEVEDLIAGNLALVGHLAREAAARLPRHLDTDDLVGAGALALVQAAHAFNPAFGVPFPRFASTRIRGAMIDQMRQRDWATRSVRSRARALSAAAESLTAALQRVPTDDELAEASGMTVAQVRAIRQGTDRAVLLSLEPIGAEDAGAMALPDDSPRPDEVLVAAERIGYLRDAMAELPERTRRVVVGYYLDHLPLTEIADELGVTQSRASQLRAEGLGLLREALSTLLQEGSPAADDPAAGGDGVRARRRDAYVGAVAKRSSLRERADVQAYLQGGVLAATQAPPPTPRPRGG